MKSRFLLALLLGASALSPAVAAQDGPERAFTGQDLFSLEGATEPEISPDGSQIAYVRQSRTS